MLSSRPPYINRMMPVRRVSKLTVQFSCNYVHGFKRLPMFIFAFHLNCVSKSCDHKLFYEEAGVLVEHGPKVWNSVIRLCIF